ncbi:MAG: hypothetical protein HC884_00115 [Chloroflexaceae bacterium]|nr:hypothetical protein [Chloroflexaceae bacterium]
MSNMSKDGLEPCRPCGMSEQELRRRYAATAPKVYARDEIIAKIRRLSPDAVIRPHTSTHRLATILAWILFPLPGRRTGGEGEPGAARRKQHRK